MEAKMRVLFVASGNSKDFEIVPFIKSQGETIRNEGIDVQYFSVFGRGVNGYLKSTIKLRKYLKYNKFDIIHTHYTLCGWVAVIVGPKIPIILSVMGDDAYGTYYGPQKVFLSSKYLSLLTYLIQPFIDGIISKSKNIDKYIYRRKIAYVIPNGVRMEHVLSYEKDFRHELDLRPEKKYVLFLANTNDNNKNFKLVQEAIALINNPNVELLAPFPVSHYIVIKYLFSVNVFVLSSFMEGSPNVIKEAMTCNCPIVAVDVGDVKWVIGNTEGCYLTDFNSKDYSEKIIQALDFSLINKRTIGRSRILKLGLDTETTAKKIIDIYNRTIK
jgi:teichuronic acid biosynthesis glycosyltransferase TuaC